MSKKEEKKYLIRLWLLILGPLVALASIIIAVITLSDLPSLEELENPKSNLASEVISSDRKILGKYYIENRTDAQFNELSKKVVDA